MNALSQTNKKKRGAATLPATASAAARHELLRFVRERRHGTTRPAELDRAENSAGATRLLNNRPASEQL
jgi:hypothetical protein